MLGRGGLRIELEPAAEGEAAIVHVFGELDMEAAPLLEEQLIALISAGTASVTVDLTALEFIDSTGLQCLLRATEHARANGDSLRFRRGSPQVEDVLRLTRVGDLLPFAD